MEQFSNLAFTTGDLITFGALLAFGLLGFLLGFVTTILSLAVWIGAFVGTFLLFPIAQPYGRSMIANELAANIATGLILFIGLLLVLTLLSFVVATILRGGKAGGLDRTLGLLFGMALGLFIISLLFHVFSRVVPPEDEPAWIRNAWVRPIVVTTGDWILRMLPPSLIDIPSSTPNPARTELPQPLRVADLGGGNAYIEPRGRVAGTPSI